MEGWMPDRTAFAGVQARGLIALLFSLCTALPLHAQDRENCLLCHRFPGLSRLAP
jgi:hypothetical protein